MSTNCKRRKNSSRVTKKSKSKVKIHHGTTSAEVIPNGADDQGIRANDVNHGNLLPLWTPWMVVLCTFVIRVYYVTNPENWWVLHPDEVFQSMDVAHSEAYGYGFRPYEFISLPRGDNLSHYQVKENILEMGALRSPLYPQLLAMVAKLLHSFGMADQPFMIWRIFHVFVTSCLPLAASLFVKASGQSLDVAALSSILIGFSSHLSVFGTHTIINSFISPFIYLSLSWLVSLLRISQGNLETDTPLKPSSQGADHEHNQYGEPEKTMLCDFTKVNGSYSQMSNSTEISICRRNSQHAPRGELSFDFPFSDKVGISNRMRHMRNSSSSDSGFDNRSNSSQTSSEGGHSDEENIVVNANAYCENCDDNDTCIQPASRHHIRNNIMNAPCYNLRGSKDASLSCISSLVIPTLNTTFDFSAGFLLGISMYIRPDSCLFVAAIVVANINFSINFFYSVIKSVSMGIFMTGVFVSILLGIGDDFYFYQDLFISPWQWFKFNVLSTLAAQLFGTSGVMFYVSKIFFGNVGVTTLSIIFMAYNVFSFVNDNMTVFESDPSDKPLREICKQNNSNILSQRFLLGAKQKFTTVSAISTTNTRYTCTVIIFVLIYTSFGHKEERFMHDVLVLYLMLISYILISGIHIVNYILTKKVILYLLMMSYCFSQWQAMPDSDGSGVNQCLHFVSQQNDVRGLFLEHTFSFTFSYSLIHRDIPLLTNLQKDYQEFDNKLSVSSSNRSCFIQRNKCKANFVSLNSVSNVIHSSNSLGIVKYLLENHQKYNYAIISSSKEFFRPAYTIVYATNSYSVWRFTDVNSHKKHLQQMAEKMVPDASQGAIEEYEAERLKQLGRYWVALDRFKSIKKHSPTTAKIQASMAFCLQRIGLMREARQAFAECLKKSGESECAKGNEVRVADAGSGKVK